MPTYSTALQELIPYSLHSHIAFTPLQKLLASLLLPYGNKSPINSIPIYSNHIFYYPVRTVPYSFYSRTAFQKLVAITSTPLQKLISYSFQPSTGIVTAILRPFIAFSSLQEPIPTSSTPLREPIPYGSRSPVPKFAYIIAYRVGLVIIGARKYIGLYPVWKWEPFTYQLPAIEVLGGQQVL